METSNFLREIRRGAFSAELGDAIDKSVASVEETFKPATVKITLTFKPMGNHKLKVSGSVDTALPKAELEDTLFFIDPENGSLSRSMPGQRSLITEEIDR